MNPIAATSSQAPVSSDTGSASPTGSRRGLRWIPGEPDEGYRNPSRFLASARYAVDGQLILGLDTSISRTLVMGTRPTYAAGDSVLVGSLHGREFFTDYCKIPSGLADGQIGGIIDVATPEQWRRPRLAWRFDTVSARIQALGVDSVSCTVPEPD